MAARVLDKSLDSLGGTSAGVSGDLDSTAASTDRMGRSGRQAGPEIDRFSGRLKLLASAGLILGPALVPLGASVIPVLTGSIAALGAAAGGIGATVLAFHGLGDAMKAIDAAELEPTAENLQAVRAELEKLGPAGAHFARFLQDLGPEMKSLQFAAREGLFPGVEQGIDDLLTRLPEVREIISELSRGVGGLAAEAGADLASEDWQPFFDYVRTTARPTLEAFGHTVGNVAQGLADMLVAFAPLSGDFSRGMEEMSASFADWAAGLQESETFQDFLDYIRQSGPQALDLLSSLAGTFVAIVEAAAPIGSAVLPVLTALVKIIGAIADSPLGSAFLTAAVAITAYNRAASLAVATSTRLKGAMMGLNARQVAAGIGLIALSLTDLDEKAGLSNTAMLGIAGMMAGPWGAAVGAGVGLTLDLAAANDTLKEAVEGADDAIRSGNVNDMLERRQQLLTEIDEQHGGLMNVGFGNGLDVLKGLLNDTTGATDEGRAAIGRLNKELANGDAIDVFGLGVVYTTRSLRDARDAAAEFSAALADLNGWFDKREAVRQYADSIKELAKGFRDGFSREDVENIDATGRNILKVASLIKDKDLRADFLAGARKSLVDLANDSGPKAAAAIQKVINKFDDENLTNPPPSKLTMDKSAFDRDWKAAAHDLDVLGSKKSKPKVELEAGNTLGILDLIKAKLGDLRDKTITVRTVHEGGFGPQESASGGTVPKSGLPYADRYLYMLADGEEVISNRHGQADRHRQLLKAINAGRMAGGGTAGGGSVRWGGDRDFSTAIHGVIDGLVALRRHLKESEKALAAETARRDDLRAKAAEVSSGISSGLRGDSIWEGSSDVWAAGATRYDPIAKLNARKDRARRMIAAINTLRGKGITGAALAEILGEGLEAAEFMASQADDMLGAYTTAYAESEAAVAEAAQLGGQETYGAAADALGPGIRELNQTVKRLQKQLDRLSGEHKGEGRKNAKDNADFVAAAINGAAKNGKRKAHR